MPEKFRVRYLRALHKLEVAGLVELFQGEGGRVENVRLTPEGAKIARELRVKKAKPGGVKLQLADGSVSTASVKADRGTRRPGVSMFRRRPDTDDDQGTLLSCSPCGGSRTQVYCTKRRGRSLVLRYRRCSVEERTGWPALTLTGLCPANGGDS